MTPAELVSRALTQRDQGEYQLGAGGWDPKRPHTTFGPHWKTGKVGSDCSRFAISWALKLAGHRPGFGKGKGARVVDDINSDSALFDAIHNHELFELVEGPPQMGDHLFMPWYFDPKTGERIDIGHVMLVTKNNAIEWDHKILPRPWERVEVVQCRGPNGKRPGVIVSSAAVCAAHDAKWVKVPSMWTQVIRVRADVLAAIPAG